MIDGARPQAGLDATITRVGLEDTSWMKHPELLADPARGPVEIAAIPLPVVPFFAGHQFFALTDPTEKPGAAVLIVVATEDGRVRSIRSLDDYNQLIADTGRSITSETAARDVAEQYARTLGTPYPQHPQSVHILQSADEVPVNPGETLPAYLRAQIQPPEVQKVGDAFVVKLSVWSEVGGALQNVVFQIAANGIVALDESVVGQGIGKHWLPK